MIKFFKILLCSTNIDWTLVAAMVTAMGTLLLVGIAYFQLKKANKISQADFDQRFKNDFFKEETEQLFMLFQYDLLVFKTEPIIDIGDEFPYFEIDMTKLNANPIYSMYLPKNKYRYSSYEIDELLLGHFEDLGLFYRKKLMDIEFIYSGFSYYIVWIHENDEIKKYIEWSRENEVNEDNKDNKDKYAEDTFDDFDLIFKKVKCYEKKKEIYRKLRKKLNCKYCNHFFYSVCKLLNVKYFQ